MKHRYLTRFLFILFLFPFIQNQGWGQLRFIENRGQWKTPYSLRAALSKGDLWLNGSRAFFVLSDFGQGKVHKGHPHANPEYARMHRYSMEFVGASPGSQASGNGICPEYHNYYYGQNPENWKTHVALYSAARQKEVYPGIDVDWKSQGDQLKYEIQVRAGANPNQIRIRYEGLDQLKVKSQGLELKTSLGTVQETGLKAWQTIGGRKVPLACRFRQAGTFTVGFEFPSGYDSRYPITIDPVLVFSTFSGSRADNWGFTATYGENGTAYAAGIALGPGFPATPGAVSGQFAGDSIGLNAYATYDISILKFSSSGSQLLYATYLGGAEAESPASLVIDNQNNLLLLGTSGSSNFPVTANAYDPGFNGGVQVSPYGPAESVVQYRTGSDIVVSKFSPDGTQLLGSTFLGGNQNDGIVSLIAQGNSPLVKNYGDSFRGEIAVDTANRVYIVTSTSSSNFPTVQAIQTAKGNGSDGICARFSPNLDQLQFSTFLGGNGDDGANSIQISPSGRVYVSGGTSSSNFRVSPNGIRPSFGGQVDGFICSFIPGQGLPSYRGTYLGTNQYDQSYFIQLDRRGNVYSYGQTLGNYPVSANTYSNPGSSQYIHCLSANLDSTRFSTVFGSGSLSTNLSPTAFLVDDCGRIYCSGWGGSTNNIPGYSNGNTQGLPITAGAYSSTSDGSDFYFLVLERNATSLTFATYFGNTSSSSEHVDGGTSRFDKKGIVYQSVCAGCGGQSSFPTTPGVYSNTNRSGNCNNAIFKYDFSLLKAAYQPSIQFGCAPIDIRFTSNSSFATQYHWYFGDGTDSLTTTDTIRHSFTAAGSYPVKLVAINPDACPGKDSVFRTIVLQKAPDLENDTLQFCSENDTLALPPLPIGTFTYSWSPFDFLNDPSAKNPLVQQPSQTTVYTGSIRTSLGCKSEKKVLVSNGILRAQAIADTLKGCRPLLLQLSANTYQAKNIRWIFGPGDSTILLSPTETISRGFSQPGLFPVRLQAMNDTTCQTLVEDTLWVRVFDLPSFPDTLIRYCENQALSLTAAANQGQEFSWSPGIGLSDSTLKNPVLHQPFPQVFQVQIRDSNSCKASAKVEIRDGRLKSSFALTSNQPCVPVQVGLSNLSLNAMNSRVFWNDDSLLLPDAGFTFIPITQAGKTEFRLRVYSDTACQAFDDTIVSITLGGVPAIADSQVPFCPGDSVSIQTLNLPGYVYIWELPAIGVPGQAWKAKAFSLDSALVRVTLRDSLQCPGNQTFQLIPQKPGSDFSITSQFDPCLDLLSYELKAVEVLNGNYFWRIDSNSFTGSTWNYRFPERKSYSVRLITSVNQCPDTLIRTVEIQDPKLVLKARFDVEVQSLACLDIPQIKVKNQSIGAERYLWEWPGGFSSEETPAIPIENAGFFPIKLQAYKGLCSADTSLLVRIQPVIPPNTLTRNEDGKNDVFVVPGLPENSRLQIRDRWGVLIFSSDNYQNNWAPPKGFGTGFYEIILPGGESCKSWLQVLE